MYNDGKEIVNPYFLWSRANFDGIHYLMIAKFGYGVYEQAFFPLYPKLVRMATPVFGGKNLLAGLFISNLSLLLALFIFYKLAILDIQERAAKRAVFFLLFFPTSFFLGMVYSESVFLFLILGSFYLARKRKWLLAGIFGGLASYTRLVGVFLFPALLYEWWSGREVRNERWEVGNMLKVFIIPTGLLVYMKFLWQKYGDPLMFLHVQPSFGAERSGGRIILIYQVFWRYLKMVLTTKSDPLYFTVWLEVLVAISFLILFILAYRAKIRFSYLIFSAFAYFIPSLSGTFSSLPRYCLVLFPAFIYLGMLKNKVVRTVVLAVFGILLVISTTLFFRGYWVS